MTTQLRLGERVPQDAVWDVCAEIGFRLSNMVPRTATHPSQAIFVSPDRLTLLHLVEDEAAGRLVIVRGARDEEVAKEFARALGGEGGAVEKHAIARALGGGTGAVASAAAGAGGSAGTGAAASAGPGGSAGTGASASTGAGASAGPGAGGGVRSAIARALVKGGGRA